MFILTTLFLACSDSEPKQTANTATKQECPNAQNVPKVVMIAQAQPKKSSLADSLSQIRTGIKPFDDASVGVCKGSGKNCEEFPRNHCQRSSRGEYMLSASPCTKNQA